MNEHSSIGNAALEGFISCEYTKDVTLQTTNAAANKPRESLDTLEQMQSQVASQVACQEFYKLQSANNKLAAKLTQ